MVLLAGATGMLGGAIADKLLRDRRAVRLLARNPARVAALTARGAEAAVGDVTRRDTLDAAMRGVTHVITTVNAFLAPSRRALEAVDLQGNRNLVDAARQAGVRQFVFTSAWLPEPYYAIDYFSAKRQTEAYLRASGLPYTILRPAAFMETWATIVGDPILKTGKVQIFGDGTNKVNFVAVDDVAAAAVETLDRPDALNAAVDIFGPENLSLLEAAAVFERLKGGPARKQHLPVAIMKLLAVVAGPFNPAFARQVKAGALMASVPQAVPPDKLGRRRMKLEEWARRSLIPNH
jgi:NADH dehydrogenase